MEQVVVHTVAELANVIPQAPGQLAVVSGTGVVYRALSNEKGAWSSDVTAEPTAPRLQDASGSKAIDIQSTDTSIGRTLYSNDGATKVFSWGNVDAGMVTCLLGLSFDNFGSFGMIDVDTLSSSSDTVTAKAAVLVNFIAADSIWLFPSANPPNTAREGMLYADTDHHMYYYNGTTWKQLDN